MKKFVAVMLAATVLAAPMAQARDDHRGADRRPHIENRIKVEKKSVKKADPRKDARKSAMRTHRWERGHRLSAKERRQMREVRNYKQYRLSAPPKGQRWVRVDNDFLLVGITSGIIASIIAGR